MILEDVQSPFGFDALNGDARADDFTQTINVDGLNIHLLFDVVAHSLGPGFSPENAQP